VNKLVSVIIPTYKRARYLKRAIDSVLNQSYTEIEILVVDDNDPNSIYRLENEKVMELYLTKYNNKIKYLKHDCNKNGAAARNTGIKNSSGEYITFLDDDDIFLKDRIKKLVEVLDKNLNYQGAYSEYVCVKNKEIIYASNSMKSGNFLCEVLAQDSFFGTGSNMFFRRSIIDKIGAFDEEFIRHQDMEYMCRFFEYSDIINVPEILVIKNVDSVQNVPNYEKMEKMKQLYLKKFEKAIQQMNIEKQKYIFFNNYYELFSFADYKSKQYKQIIKKIKELKLPLKYKFKLLKQRIKRTNRFFYKISLIKTYKLKKEIQNKVNCKKLDEIYSFYKEQL